MLAAWLDRSFRIVFISVLVSVHVWISAVADRLAVWANSILSRHERAAVPHGPSGTASLHDTVLGSLRAARRSPAPLHGILELPTIHLLNSSAPLERMGVAASPLFAQDRQDR